MCTYPWAASTGAYFCGSKVNRRVTIKPSRFNWGPSRVGGQRCCLSTAALRCARSLNLVRQLEQSPEHMNGHRAATVAFVVMPEVSRRGVDLQNHAAAVAQRPPRVGGDDVDSRQAQSRQACRPGSLDQEVRAEFANGGYIVPRAVFVDRGLELHQGAGG